MSGASIAYVKRDWICSASIAPDGRLAGAPHRLFRVPGGARLRSLAVSPDGQTIAISVGRSDYSPDEMFISAARPGARPRRLREGGSPSFSPRGRWLVFVFSAQGGLPPHDQVWLRDLRTGRDRLLRAHATDPSWSGDGQKVVVEDLGGEADMNGPPLVLDAETGKEVKRPGRDAGGDVPLMSPDGRYIAACVRVSRPKFAPHIIDLRTGKLRNVPHVGGPVLAWSPDSRWLAWTRWVLYPDNDGAYTRLEVWISSPDASQSHRIGTGYPAVFSPDSRHALYVSGGGFDKPGDLTVADPDGRHRRVLVRGVEPVLAASRR